jgi:hypothetical protein
VKGHIDLSGAIEAWSGSEATSKRTRERREWRGDCGWREREGVEGCGEKKKVQREEKYITSNNKNITLLLDSQVCNSMLFHY